MGRSDILREDAKAIYIGNLNTVDADLTLPLTGKNGSSISWQSSRPHVIKPDGTVIRPHPGTGNRDVVLTAALRHGDETHECTFNCTVLARELDWTAKKLLPRKINISFAQSRYFELPAYVIAEKDTGGHTALLADWDKLPEMKAPGMYLVYGKPPLEKQLGLLPLAEITVVERLPQTVYPDEILHPFPLKNVCINGGIFAENKSRMLEFLLNVNDDSMLYNFRDAAGLDTKGAPPATGWDAPECLLKGHTTGHYLSALSLACCCGADEEKYRDKLRYMIKSLAECQDAMEKSGKFNDGFLSGYSEEQFDLLEQYVTYPNIWAPYYTLHKIMAGLLDAYEHAYIPEALMIAEKIGFWMYNRLNACGKEKRAKMWAMYIAGEYGGMNEAMARLFKLIAEPEYMRTARFFDNEPLFGAMAENINVLPGMHGNQHVPQMVGALEMYKQTSERGYYDAAHNFWHIVTENHCYSIGGLGEGEMFTKEKQIASNLTEKTAESCASYNMLKLTHGLFLYTKNPAMADYYERTLYNHIIASHDQSGATGGSTYFMPLNPGGKKEYDTDGNSCCHGTGLESHLKYQEMVYLHDGDSLYVNLFIASSLNWEDKNIQIVQKDGYLENECAEFEIIRGGNFKLKLHIPGWMNGKPQLQLNGAAADYISEDGYGVMERDFKDGDRVKWLTPFTLRFEEAPDNPEIGSFIYGPLVLAAVSDEKDFLKIGGITPVKTGVLTFECGGYVLRPNFMCWDCCYHVYVMK